MTESFQALPTEARNPRTTEIDRVPTLDMVVMLNEENKRVAPALDAILPQVAQAVDRVAEALRQGGRLIYLGAGTSGRLGVLDAAECPPTFGVDPGLVCALIAGGPQAVTQAVEGAEDDGEAGARDLEGLSVCGRDAVCGIAASGRTPYVLGALARARQAGALTLSISCNPGGPLDRLADLPLSVEVGPEAITGSTRLKAGTAQKLLLNMLSTGVMVRTGKVYENMMINLRPTNEKLRDRAARIVSTLAGVPQAEAAQALVKSGWDIRLALRSLGKE